MHLLSHSGCTDCSCFFSRKAVRGFTENKSNSGSGALNDLMFILYCRVITQWLPTRRRAVGDQLGSDRQRIGDRSTTGWRLYLERLFMIATDRRLVGDQSATENCVGIVCNRCNWSAIIFGRREVSLAAIKISLRPNRPCNLLQPPCDRPATSL